MLKVSSVISLHNTYQDVCSTIYIVSVPQYLLRIKLDWIEVTFCWLSNFQLFLLDATYIYEALYQKLLSPTQWEYFCHLLCHQQMTGWAQIFRHQEYIEVLLLYPDVRQPAAGTWPPLCPGFHEWSSIVVRALGAGSGAPPAPGHHPSRISLKCAETKLQHSSHTTFSQPSFLPAKTMIVSTMLNKPRLLIAMGF